MAARSSPRWPSPGDGGESALWTLTASPARRHDRGEPHLHPDRHEYRPACPGPEQRRDRLPLGGRACQFRGHRRDGHRLERWRRLARRLGDGEPNRGPHRQRWRAPGAPRLGPFHRHGHAAQHRLAYVEGACLPRAGLLRQRRPARGPADRPRHRSGGHADTGADPTLAPTPVPTPCRPRAHATPDRPRHCRGQSSPLPPRHEPSPPSVSPARAPPDAARVRDRAGRLCPAPSPTTGASTSGTLGRQRHRHGHHSAGAPAASGPSPSLAPRAMRRRAIRPRGRGRCGQLRRPRWVHGAGRRRGGARHGRHRSAWRGAMVWFVPTGGARRSGPAGAPLGPRANDGRPGLGARHPSAPGQDRRQGRRRIGQVTR